MIPPTANPQRTNLTWPQVQRSVKTNPNVFGPKVRQLVNDARGDPAAVTISIVAIAAMIILTAWTASEAPEIIGVPASFGGALVLMSIGLTTKVFHDQYYARRQIARDEATKNRPLLVRLLNEDADAAQRELQLTQRHLTHRAHILRGHLSL